MLPRFLLFQFLISVVAVLTVAEDEQQRDGRVVLPPTSAPKSDAPTMLARRSTQVRDCNSVVVPPCARKGNRDIVFLVDASESLDAGKFYSQFLDFVQTAWCGFDSNDVNRGAMITFGHDVTTRIPFAKYTATEWFQKVDTVRADPASCCSCCTPTAEAFRAARMLLTANVPLTQDTTRLVMLISDGDPWQNTVNTPFPFPKVLPASYTFQVVPQQAYLLKNLNNEKDSVRLLFLGVPNKDGKPPSVDYFIGNGVLGKSRCIRRGRRKQCVKIPVTSPYFPISSSPVDKYISVSDSFDVGQIIAVVGDDLCRPLSEAPSVSPTKMPTLPPGTTKAPTRTPTFAPTNAPTTKAPTTKTPTLAPTNAPTTKAPTKTPTNVPGTTSSPTAPTTKTPTLPPTNNPTTGAPTKLPTFAPTNAPTSNAPTKLPTFAPTNDPTTKAPTTKAPTFAPGTTGAPTAPTTKTPTFPPSNSPTSKAPTKTPTFTSAEDPSVAPTRMPTFRPTAPTTQAPSQAPIVINTTKPDFDHLDLYLFLDRSKSMRWRAPSCRAAPGSNQTASDQTICWQLFLGFAKNLANKTSYLTSSRTKQRLGWQAGMADPSKGLRVWLYGFACANHQKTPIIQVIGEKINSWSAFQDAIAAASSIIPDGGTCPGAAFERAIGMILANDLITRPYKAALLFTDGVFYDQPRPADAAAGFAKFGVMTYSLGISIPDNGNNQGLTPREIKDQKKQLLAFANGVKSRYLNFGVEGYSLLDSIATSFVTQLPIDVEAHIPQIIDRPWWCGWSSSERCLNTNPETFDTSKYCKWIPSNPDNFDGNGKCRDKDWCKWGTKAKCKADVWCTFSGGVCSFKGWGF